MQCRQCGREVELRAGERVGFRDACEGCGGDLHSCVHCAHHDRSAYNECREPNAERVSDRERANRCDYFAPADAGGGVATRGRDEARDALEKLFRR